MGTRSSQPSGVIIESKQVQLGMLRDLALHKQRALLRIEAGGQKVQRHVECVLLDLAKGPHSRVVSACQSAMKK